MTLIPEAKKGIAEVTHFEVPKGYLDFSALSHGIASPAPGKYMRLRVNGSLVMSNTQMELDSNWRVMHRSFGRVLIGGLGLGMVLQAVLASKKVEAVTVVEKYQDVIDLVAPHYACRKLEVICGDILTWKPPNGVKWNTIYFDIWQNMCVDNLEQIATLHRRFGKRLDRKAEPRSWMDSWMADRLRAIRERDRGRW